MIKSFNQYKKERILLLLLNMKIAKDDKEIANRLHFEKSHKNENGKYCHLDEMIFNLQYLQESLYINTECFCECKEGLDYLLKMLKIFNPSSICFRTESIKQKDEFYKMILSNLSNLKTVVFLLCKLDNNLVKSLSKLFPHTLITNTKLSSMKNYIYIILYMYSYFQQKRFYSRNIHCR